jgi:hypothetical protein
MEHLRRSAGFGRARLNGSLAMRAGTQNRRPGAKERLAWPRIVWPCRSLPFGTSRTGSTGPSLPPAGAVSLSPGDHLVERRGLALSKSERREKSGQIRAGNGTRRTGQAFCSSWAIEEESNMPVLLLWAVPAVIVVGGVGYYLVRAVH